MVKALLVLLSQGVLVMMQLSLTGVPAVSTPSQRTQPHHQPLLLL